jgi:hypothetical protein
VFSDNHERAPCAVDASKRQPDKHENNMFGLRWMAYLSGETSMNIVLLMAGLLGILNDNHMKAPKWQPVDGQCIADKEFPDLSDVLRDGGSWPYGRCDSEHFRLPKLKCPDDRSENWPPQEK